LLKEKEAMQLTTKQIIYLGLALAGAAGKRTSFRTRTPRKQLSKERVRLKRKVALLFSAHSLKRSCFRNKNIRS